MSDFEGKIPNRKSQEGFSLLPFSLFLSSADKKGKIKGEREKKQTKPKRQVGKEHKKI